MDPDRISPTCTTSARTTDPAPPPRDPGPAAGGGTRGDRTPPSRLRRLGARIGEAVRAAHAASVPF